MIQSGESRIPELLATHESELLERWLDEQKRAGVSRRDLIGDAELREQSSEFLRVLRHATASGNLEDIGAPEWTDVREQLAATSRSRSIQGFNPKDVATFVFSFKRPLFELLRRETGGDQDALFREIWAATTLLDQLGYWTTEVFQRTREEVIARQQQEMLELSTPVVKLWDGILALPMIGTLDSNRTQIVMESLLQRIVETGSEIAIIDITGVPTVDTLVAQHLLKTVAAARLMGADCIISGIRPQIAQTIVHLGVDLSTVSTKATLADAFKLALQRNGRALKSPQQPKA
jgi:rsbT co-antagonist protein RsbR